MREHHRGDEECESTTEGRGVALSSPVLLLWFLFVSVLLM